MPQRISTRTLYLNADRTKVLEDGDPDAAFLLVRAGSAVDEAAVARLEKSGLKVTIPVAEAKAKAPAENKAVAKAPANKAKE